MISLIISNDYTHTHFGLFTDSSCLARIGEKNKKTSKYLMFHIDALCAQHNVTLSDINYIGVNQGPGPFTTLRSILSSVNGIAFATNTPLIGIDGISALIAEHTDAAWPYTIALYNAFNKDAYYAIQAPERELKIGYKKIDLLLHELKDQYRDVPLRFIGSGVETFYEQITDILGEQAHIPKELPLAPSLEQCAKIAQQKYERQETAHKLLPLYLKVLQYKKSITE